jgi:hypothetical protein
MISPLGILSLSSAGVPRALREPLYIMPILSESLSASSMSFVAIITVEPSSLIALILSQT